MSSKRLCLAASGNSSHLYARQCSDSIDQLFLFRNRGASAAVSIHARGDLKLCLVPRSSPPFQSVSPCREKIHGWYLAAPARLADFPRIPRVVLTSAWIQTLVASLSLVATLVTLASRFKSCPQPFASLRKVLVWFTQASCSSAGLFFSCRVSTAANGKSSELALMRQIANNQRLQQCRSVSALLMSFMIPAYLLAIDGYLRQRNSQLLRGLRGSDGQVMPLESRRDDYFHHLTHMVEFPANVAGLTLGGVVTCLGVLFRISKPTSRMLDVGNLIVTVSVCLSCLLLTRTFQDIQGYYTSPGWLDVLPARVIQVIFFGNAWLSIPLQTFISLLSLSVLHVFGASKGDVYGANDFPLQPYDVRRGVSIESMIWLTLVAMSAVLQHERFKAAAAIFHADTSKKSESLARNLLDGVCDATIRLDSELKLVGDVSKLGLLLFRSRLATEALGTSILDYMPAEDAESFQMQLKSREVDTCSYPMHVRMYDADSNKVNLELFCVQWKDIEDRFQYLIGIKEEIQPFGQLVPDAHEQPQFGNTQATDGIQPSTSDKECSSASASNSSVIEEPTLQFDDSGMILQTNEAFKNLYPPEWNSIAVVMQQLFERQEVCDTLLSWATIQVASPPESRDDEFGPVRIKLPSPLGDRNVLYSVSWRLDDSQPAFLHQRRQIVARLVKIVCLDGKRRLETDSRRRRRPRSTRSEHSQSSSGSLQGTPRQGQHSGSIRAQILGSPSLSL
eukprot:TRINITY_DN11700_c0_g1_i5.p1 TRINITY_DN11700_c0_g1~~TRINITY_DN11700_c0_g1_i5.p1  ORF type:complete len:770 (+),score=73.46 TRINITY_DN11700_c0_g1_i5:113-2311(+)